MGTASSHSSTRTTPIIHQMEKRFSVPRQFVGFTMKEVASEQLR
jgi:hypothetical protein